MDFQKLIAKLEKIEKKQILTEAALTLQQVAAAEKQAADAAAATKQKGGFSSLTAWDPKTAGDIALSKLADQHGLPGLINSKGEFVVASSKRMDGETGEKPQIAPPNADDMKALSSAGLMPSNTQGPAGLTKALGDPMAALKGEPTQGDKELGQYKQQSATVQGANSSAAFIQQKLKRLNDLVATISAPATQESLTIAQALLKDFGYQLNEKVTLGSGPAVTNPATGVTAGKFQKEVAEIKTIMSELADIDDPEVAKALQAAQAALDKLSAPAAGAAPAGGSGNPPAASGQGGAAGPDQAKMKRFQELLNKIKSPSAGGNAAGGTAAVGGAAGGKQLAKPDPGTKELQNFLIANGFNVGPTGADGRFGKNTNAAYQAAKAKFAGTPKEKELTDLLNKSHDMGWDPKKAAAAQAQRSQTPESINESSELSKILGLSRVLLERGGIVPFRPPAVPARPGTAITKPTPKPADDVIDVTAKEIPNKAGMSTADKMAVGTAAAGGAAVVGGAMSGKKDASAPPAAGGAATQAPAGVDASGRRTAATDPRVPGNAPTAGNQSDAGAGQSSSAFAAQDPRRLDLKKPGAAPAAAPAGGSGNPASALSKQELDELDAIARELQSSQDPSVIELMGQYNALRPKLGAATPVPGEPE